MNIKCICYPISVVLIHNEVWIIGERSTVWILPILNFIQSPEKQNYIVKLYSSVARLQKRWTSEIITSLAITLNYSPANEPLCLAFV